MSDSTPNDPTRRPMPWEPQQPDAAPAPATPPTPPEPAPPEPPTPEPLTPPADDAPTTQSAGLISAAPVGWAAEPGPTSAGSSPVVGWAPPPPTVPTMITGDLAISPVLPRAVAYIFDAVLLGLVNLAISAALGAYDADALTGRLTPQAITATLIATVIDVTYFIGLWRSGSRATLGMRVLHLRVLDIVSGERLTLAAAAKRWLLLQGVVTFGVLAVGIALPADFGFAGIVAIIWALVLLVSTGTHPRQQGLHDRWANSVVVRPIGAGSGAAVVTCLVVVFVIGLLPIVALALMGSQLSEILSSIGNSI